MNDNDITPDSVRTTILAALPTPDPAAKAESLREAIEAMDAPVAAACSLLHLRGPNVAGSLERSYAAVCDALSPSQPAPEPTGGEGRYWLLWSDGHRAFWRVGGDGYSLSIAEAGRFEYTEAADLVHRSKLTNTPAIMLRAPESPNLDGTPSASSPAAPSAPEKGEDSLLLDALRDNCWDLRCKDVPTGGGDAYVHWEVIEHHMSRPHERVVGDSFSEEPREAIREALAPQSPAADGTEASNGPV